MGESEKDDEREGRTEGETSMMLSLTESYDEDFDLAAADKHSLWLPQPPVPDTEASESRGMPDFKHPDGEHLPGDPKARKQIPLHSGLVAYFPDALIAVAAVSFAGNAQHNPGQPLHWSRGKSDDHEDALLRHHFEAGQIDPDGHRASAKRAWRAGMSISTWATPAPTLRAIHIP